MLESPVILDAITAHMIMMSVWYRFFFLHRTAEGIGTDLRPKNGHTRGYSGAGRQGRMFLLCYSPEGHKLLLKTHNNSGLLAIEIDKLHYRFDIRFTPNRDQLRTDLRVEEKSGVFLDSWAGKLLPNDTGNSGRSRPGRMSVANRSQSITGQSEVGRKCITTVGPWLWFWGKFMPVDLRMACEGCELSSLSWCGWSHSYYLANYTLSVYSYVRRSPTSM